MRRDYLAGGLAILSLLAGSPAPAADFVYAPAGDASICSETRVLSRVSKNFRHQVNNVPNLPDVEILDYVGPRLTRYFPVNEDRPIERTYCQATALLSDGASRQVWYLVEGGQGFAGFVGDNVEFCVAGFDRWHVYNDPLCRVLRDPTG